MQFKLDKQHHDTLKFQNELKNAQAQHQRELQDVEDIKKREFTKYQRKIEEDIQNRERQIQEALKQHNQALADHYTKQVCTETQSQSCSWKK